MSKMELPTCLQGLERHVCSGLELPHRKHNVAHSLPRDNLAFYRHAPSAKHGVGGEGGPSVTFLRVYFARRSRQEQRHFWLESLAELAAMLRHGNLEAISKLSLDETGGFPC